MSKGFTLIELLVTIILIALIIAAVIVGIDPVDKINSSNDAKVITNVAILASAFENNATVNNGNYSDNLDFLVAVGEIKSIPVPPDGYCDGAYKFGAGGVSQTVWCNLKSKKYSATPYWYWCSITGESHAVSTIPATCP